MQEQEDSEGRFDHTAAALLGRFSERASRRSFLTRLGKLSLVVLGVSVMEALPADRRALAADCYGDWRLCGICGKTCDCCNSTGYITDCPDHSDVFNAWATCCPVPGSGTSYLIQYYDCCGSALNCCPKCSRNCPQDTWCNGEVYRCTKIVFGPEC